MTSYIQRLMTASREELEAPVKSAVKEAIADAHAHDVSTVGTRKGQVVLVRPNGEAVAYPESKKRTNQSLPTVKNKGERDTVTHYALLKRRPRNAAYRHVRDALDHPRELAASAAGQRQGVSPAKPVAGGTYYARLQRDPVTGLFIAEEKRQRSYKNPRKGDALSVHSRQVVTVSDNFDLAQGRVFVFNGDDNGPSIMTDGRYFGLPFKASQVKVKAERSQHGFASAFGPKSTKKKSATRKGRHDERG